LGATRTGLKLSTYFSGVKLRWLIDHHELYAKLMRKMISCSVLSSRGSFMWVLSLLVTSFSKCPLKRLTDRKIHVTEVSNASRTLLMNIKTLQWDPVLLKFFRIKLSVLPKIVSSSQVYGEVEHGPLKGVKIGGLIGDQQGALVGNKCFHQGEAKCTFGTGAFLLFNTGNDVVKSDSGLLGTVVPPLIKYHLF
jgi:glycerol kinase